jgi:3-oxoacyl-[acyl-carrier-protein] synthase III
MHYSRARLDSIGYVLPSIAVHSGELETALASCYARLKLPVGQLASLTGVVERRWWPVGVSLAEQAVAAAELALERAAVPREAIGALIYCGVCREQFEPATACRVAAGLRLPALCEMFDLSNACLGVLNGMVEIANRIELSQIRAGLVVSAESAREIIEETIQRLNQSGTSEDFRLSVATLTGGSGAVAVLLTDGSFRGAGHRLVGGTTRCHPEHYELCRWGVERVGGLEYRQFMKTEASGVLRHGVELGSQTFHQFLQELNWRKDDVDRVICHQVGSFHRDQVLTALGLQVRQDFATFPLLGNTGTVALPLSAALADEQGFLQRGQRVAFLGIGSGLTCQMLGWLW